MLSKEYEAKTEEVVQASVILGISIVQDIAHKALAKRPNITLKQFMLTLDKYVASQKTANTND